MVVPSPTEEVRANSTLRKIWLFPENDDDDDDDDNNADDDDSDDEESPLESCREGWLSRPDFGSPEWWSRT
jgi:hypothetical protein